MNKEFEGKYAVVTGGAGGISYEAAKALAKTLIDNPGYLGRVAGTVTDSNLDYLVLF